MNHQILDCVKGTAKVSISSMILAVETRENRYEGSVYHKHGEPFAGFTIRV